VITKLKPKCPCGHHLRSVEGGDSATFTYRRTCHRCHSVWVVTVQPGLKLSVGRAHVLDLVAQ